MNKLIGVLLAISILGAQGARGARGSRILRGRGGATRKKASRGAAQKAAIVAGVPLPLPGTPGNTPGVVVVPEAKGGMGMGMGSMDMGMGSMGSMGRKFSFGGRPLGKVSNKRFPFFNRPGFPGGVPPNFPFPLPLPLPQNPGGVPLPLPQNPGGVPLPLPQNPGGVPLPLPQNPAVMPGPGTAPAVIDLPLDEILAANERVDQAAIAIRREVAAGNLVLPDGDITILAPASFAITALPGGVGSVTSDMLEGHIVAEPFDLATLRTGASFTTLAGTNISLNLNSSDLEIVVRDAGGNLLGIAPLLQNDVFGQNGVIHVIGGILPVA